MVTLGEPEDSSACLVDSVPVRPNPDPMTFMRQWPPSIDAATAASSRCVQRDVRVALGPDDEHPDARLPVERVDGVDLGASTPNARDERHQVEAVRRAEQALEPVAGQRRALGQEREDPTAVVVEHDDREVDAPVGEAQQAVRVVEEGDVADQQRGLRAR